MNTTLKMPKDIIETVKAGFQNRRVLIVGDLMLDRYFWGVVERISPEAPVPVVRLNHRTHAAGGAANVAANLSALGCAVSVVGIVGLDEDARVLLELMRSAGIETTGVLSLPDRPTTCKTRVLDSRQQMMRLDVETSVELSLDIRQRLVAAMEAQMPGCSAIVLSDYGKGILSEFVCHPVIRYARELGIATFVDPKGANYQKYAGCDFISPNRGELAAAVASDSHDLAVLLEKGERLRSDLEIRHLVVTLGELGIVLLDATGVHRFPAVAREVFDVSGAGDTVIATISASQASGLDLHDSMRLANLAAGIVVGKLGTVPISRNELLARLALQSAADQGIPEKICSVDELLKQVAHWRVNGQRIAFTNGCFDLLHVGHLSLLEQAKREGDRLIVALNTDRSVRAIKRHGRPIISEDARARIVAALPFVDAVVLFDEATPLDLIRAIQPHVLVKGSDYSEEEVVGAKEMKSWGGRVTLIPLIEGSSTTAILERAAASVRDNSSELVQ